MSEESKAKVQEGMAEARSIRAYLGLVQSDGFRTRGPRARTPEQLQEAIAATTDPVERLKLRPQLRAAVEIEMTESDLVKNFVEHCGAFSLKHGITYADWRDEGVPAAVLKEAGVNRAS